MAKAGVVKSPKSMLKAGSTVRVSDLHEPKQSQPSVPGQADSEAGTKGGWQVDSFLLLSPLKRAQVRRRNTLKLQRQAQWRTAESTNGARDHS